MPQHSKTIEQILGMIESAEGPEQLDLTSLKKLVSEARKPKKRGNPNPSNTWIKEALIAKEAESGVNVIEITLEDFGAILNEALEIAKETQKPPSTTSVRRSLALEGLYFYRTTDDQGKISGYKLVKSDQPPEDWPYQSSTPVQVPDPKKDATGGLPEAPF